jgi:DNA-binding response OmpR family regulator
MQSPRVLIVTANPVLERAHHSRLTWAGFAPEVARDGESALNAVMKNPPQCVVLDLVLPTMEGVAFIREIRAHPQFDGLPVIVLPTLHTALVEAAHRAGITHALDRQQHPADALPEFARNLFSLPTPTRERPPLSSMPAGTGELLDQVRSALQNVGRDTADWGAWRELFHRVHHVAEAVALGGEGCASQFAFAFEAFAADIAGMPDQASPSVVRTMSQAVDFLGILIEGNDRAVLDASGPGKILIVDDEPGALQLIAAAMQYAGLSPTTAATPSAGLAAAKRARFDLIFLDIGLPEMSGFDLCSQLRATPGHDRVPIVFLTGMATFQNRAQSSLSGGNDFIGKPFHVLELGVKALIWLFRGQLGLV